MPRVYSQRREDPRMIVIAESPSAQACRDEIARLAHAWIKSKPGRRAKGMGSLEIGLMFSSGKMACSLWVEMLPPPMGENPFVPATGPIPGMTEDMA